MTVTRPAVSTEVSTRILRFIFQFRRLPSRGDPCRHTPCEQCFTPHRARLEFFVGESQPIHFILPAFPAKSPNRTKVLGALPDMAERLALEFLQSFCDQVRHFHPPGARVTICSDGHVFGDLVGVPDPDVSAYRVELDRMITASGWESLDLYGLDDAFGGRDYERLRRMLEFDYAVHVDELREQVRRDPDTRSLFNGIHRFMFEDQSASRPGASRTKVRHDSKELAYQVIRRSNAWSRLVAEKFPASVRLSIHPQPAHSQKIGFHLIRTRNNWLTPWHGVVLDNGHGVILVKRSEAERMNASLVWRGDRPSHFVAPHVDFEEALSP